MEGIFYFILTIAVAWVGSVVAQKIRMPAGAMMGPMIFVAAFNLLTGRGVFYEDIRTVCQLFMGAMIGVRVGRKDVRELKKVIVPTLFLVVFMIVMNITVGVSMFSVGGLDVATAMFASSPGGMSDMAMISTELGANGAYVTLLQLIRLLTIYIFMPTIIKKIMQKKHIVAKEETEGCEQAHPVELSRKQKLLRFTYTMLAAASLGLIFYFLDISAGAMLGAMFASAALNIFWGKCHYPKGVRQYVQVISGAYLGMQMDAESLAHIGSLIVPTLIMVAGVLLFALGSAFLIHRITKLDLAVCLMACCPGGVQEMALLSEELGADTPKIAVMQTARLMSVIAIFPTMIAFLTGIFGG